MEQWYANRDAVMTQAITLKYLNCKPFRDCLAESGGKQLVEGTFSLYWAAGLNIREAHTATTFPGQNRLGELLMELRRAPPISETPTPRTAATAASAAVSAPASASPPPPPPAASAASAANTTPTSASLPPPPPPTSKDLFDFPPLVTTPKPRHASVPSEMNIGAKGKAKQKRKNSSPGDTQPLNKRVSQLLSPEDKQSIKSHFLRISRKPSP